MSPGDFILSADIQLVRSGEPGARPDTGEKRITAHRPTLVELMSGLPGFMSMVNHTENREVIDSD